MGQKVSPIGMRVGVTRDWNSKWFADKTFGDTLQEDVKIRKYLLKECKPAKVSAIEIDRVAKNIVINVKVAQAGIILGEEGKKIEKIKENVQKLVANKDAKIQINVVALANPDLDAHVVAQNIAEQLENRASFRTAQKKAIQQTMKSGAKGIRTLVSGRLGGADIARGEGYSEGVVPLHTIRSDIDYALAEADTTYGKLGVKVWICRGEVLRGQMVQDPEAPKFKETARPDRRNNRRFENRNEKAAEAVVENKEVTENVNA